MGLKTKDREKQDCFALRARNDGDIKVKMSGRRGEWVSGRKGEWEKGREGEWEKG